MREVFLVQSEHEGPRMRRSKRDTLVAITETRLHLIRAISVHESIEQYFGDGVDAVIAQANNDIITRLARSRDMRAAARRATRNHLSSAQAFFELEYVCFATIKREIPRFRYCATEQSIDELRDAVDGVLDMPDAGEELTFLAEEICGRIDLGDDSPLYTEPTASALMGVRDGYAYDKIRTTAGEKSIVYMGTHHEMTELREDPTFRVYRAVVTIKRGTVIVTGQLPDRVRPVVENGTARFDIEWRDI